ncbi:MAG TPA: hypothetical protein DDE71_02100 [Tenacibaculum sp.]|nr:hypothetical protein [Tenacibaculum sp.]
MWLIEGYIAIKRDVLGIIGNLYAKIVELQMHMCLEWMVRGKMILKSPIEGEGGNPLYGLYGKRVKKGGGIKSLYIFIFMFISLYIYIF